MAEFSIPATILASFAVLWRYATVFVAWAQPHCERLIDGHLGLIESVKNAVDKQTAILEEISHNQRAMLEIIKKDLIIDE